MNIVELKKRKALCSKPCRAVREERPVLPKGKRILQAAYFSGCATSRSGNWSHTPSCHDVTSSAFHFVRRLNTELRNRPFFVY